MKTAILMALFAATASAEAISVDDIVKNVFLGQAYPSGHVYLRQFSASQSDTPFLWPQKLVSYGLNKPSTGVNATFLDVVNQEDSEISVPSFEGMDGRECGKKYQKNPKLEYREKDDFFDTVFDMCMQDTNIGRYKAESKFPDSFNAIGIGSALKIEKFSSIPANMLRPLEKSEKAEIAKLKREAKNPETECTTLPAYRDSAIQLLQASIKDSPYEIRVSNYENPGCAGHLSEIYILDVLEKGKVQKSFTLIHYFGAI